VTVCLCFSRCRCWGISLRASLDSISDAAQAGVGACSALVASLLLLPVIPDVSWKPLGPKTRCGAFSDCLERARLPYFLLSSTQPAAAGVVRTHARIGIPYRLFALSNLGSMLALVSYPVLVEPGFSTLHRRGVGHRFRRVCVVMRLVAMGARGKG